MSSTSCSTTFSPTNPASHLRAGLVARIQQADLSFASSLCSQILVVGPKLVFSYTLAQTLIPLFGKYSEYRFHHELGFDIFTLLWLISHPSPSPSSV